jgi:phosphopantetheine adenylyltransferase
LYVIVRYYDIAVDVVGLDDVMGPAATIRDLDGIVVSSETLSAARAINIARIESGLQPLTVLVLRRTQQAALSSTSIRKQHLFPGQASEVNMQ